MTNTNANAQASALDPVVDHLPLAGTGMLIVFTALFLIAACIALLPRVLERLAPFLPPEPAPPGPSAAAPADAADHGRRLAAAIGAALHRHRSSN